MAGPTLRLVRDDDQPLLDMLTHMYPAWDIALDGGAWRAVRRQRCNCPRAIYRDTAPELACRLGELDLRCRPSA